MSGVKITGLNLAYEDKKIFENFDIGFGGVKISVLLGESGVGKSTLLNAIASLLPYEGQIEKSGEVSYIFQKDRLIPNISVFENLELVLRSIEKDKAKRREKIKKMLEVLEISELSGKFPSEISGGELQRVAMARAYLYPAEILLADEPFKALDFALKARLLKELLKLNDKEGRTVVFVTHDIDECLFLADEYFVLGGSPAEIALRGEIDIPKSERRLGSAELMEEREKLLNFIGEVAIK